MARARYRGTFDTLAAGAPQYFSVVPNAIVTAYEAGTTTPIAQTIYAARTGGTTLPNPMTADSDGSLEFWLDEPQDVSLSVDGSGSGLGTITVDWEPVPPTVSNTATFSRAGTFTARQTFGAGGWPADYDSPSSYEPVKTPVNAAFVDGSTAAPSTTVAPAVSFSRITAGDWIGEGAGNTYLIGQFNITAERHGNGSLNPLTTQIAHDVFVVKALQTTAAAMQAVTGIVVQDATRGTAPFHTDNTTTKADAQKNISGFAAFFLADAWDPLFEAIGGEVNVLSDYGTTDASAEYYKSDGTQVGQAPWVNNLGATQPYQPGRHIGWSIVGKGWTGHTVALVIGADGYGTDGSHTATANAGKWATAIDIQIGAIWSGRSAIRVQAANPSLQTQNAQWIVWDRAASTTVSQSLAKVLRLNPSDSVELNAISGEAILFQINETTKAQLDANGFGYMIGGGAPSYPFHGSTSSVDRAAEFDNVRTTGTNYGVVGSATGAATVNTGVYGSALNAGTNWAVYADGNLKAAGASTLDGAVSMGSTLTVASTLTLTANPRVRARGNATQSVNDSTWTTLNLNVDDLDVGDMHYTSNAALTGTVAKTASSAALVGTGTAFTTELSVGQVFSVPGTAVEKRVVTAITDNTHLTVNTAYANSASGQTATRISGAIVFRTAGFYTVDGGVTWASNATGLRYCRLLLNDATVLKTINVAAVNGDTTDLGIATQYTVSQWDFLELQGYQTSGGALNSNPTQGGPVLMAEKAA